MARAHVNRTAVGVAIAVLALALGAIGRGDEPEAASFLEDVQERALAMKHDRGLSFVQPGLCGRGASVVIYGGNPPDLEEIRDNAPPMAKFSADQVEFIRAKQMKCLSGLGTIPGNLIIYDDGGIGSLDALSNLAVVGGHLIIFGGKNRFGPQLSSLDGLQKVQVIQGSLNMVNMDEIQTLDGLKSLTQVGEDILFWNTGKLANFTGIGTINRIAKTLYLDNNRGLKNLAGLEKLEEIGFDLHMKGNGQLSDLSALRRLKRVFNTLIVDNMKALTSLTDLENLEELGNGIDINANPVLRNLTGLENLKKISGDVVITANDIMDSVHGLHKLKAIGMNLVISQNPAIEDLTAFSKVKSVGGLVAITDNPTLETLEGLGGIEEIREDLVVQRNLALETLSDLAVERVGTNIGGNIIIQDNPELRSLGDLPDTVKTVRGAVLIDGNSAAMPEDDIDTIASKALEKV